MMAVGFAETLTAGEGGARFAPQPASETTSKRPAEIATRLGLVLCDTGPTDNGTSSTTNATHKHRINHDVWRRDIKKREVDEVLRNRSPFS